jgi:hypothetical protein
MSNFLEETFDSTVTSARYIKHPPEGLSQDGDPVSASVAQTLSNNIVHMARESVRHIAWIQGPGNPGKSGDPSGYSGLLDTRQPYGTLADHQKISWDRTTAVRIGPIFAIPDQDGIYGGQVIWRAIKVAVYGLSATSNSCKINVALCPENVTPFDNVYYYLGTWTSLPTSRGFITFNTFVSNPVVASLTQFTQMQCRSSSGTQTFVKTYPMNIWVGWYSTDSGDSVDTISVWESREVTIA